MGVRGKVTYPKVIECLVEAVTKNGQRTVSRDSGVALKSLQRFLKGDGEPTTATLQKLADYFEVSVPYLRGDLGTPAMLHGFISEEVNKLGLDRFAKESGLSLENIQAYLNSDFMPSESDFIKLSEYFKVSVHELRGGLNELYMNAGSRDEELMAFEGLVYACGNVFKSILAGPATDMSPEQLEAMLKLANYVCSTRAESEHRNNKLDEIIDSAKGILDKFGGVIGQKKID